MKQEEEKRVKETIWQSVRQDKEEQGEEEEVYAVESSTEKDQMHCLMMFGEYLGVRGLGWMILGGI